MPGTRAATSGGLSRRDAAVAGIIRAWRRLTTEARASRVGAGKSTLIACSGGADSCALLLSLAVGAPRRGTVKLVVGHVVHDLRPRPEADADRDAVRALAEQLGLSCIERRVEVRRGGGNLEAAARAARYAALIQMARDGACDFVATGHHAGDQLETVLMTLLRGTGATGVRGLAVRRRLAGASGGRRAVTLIRPMASRWCGRPIDHAACVRLCTEAEVTWREDATNEDDARLRNALRRRVVPVLRELRPDVLQRAAHAAEQSAGVATLLRERAVHIYERAILLKEGLSWPRAALRREPGIVLCELMRLAHREAREQRRADRLLRRRMNLVADAIRDRGTDARTFDLAGLTIVVAARVVSFV